MKTGILSITVFLSTVCFFSCKKDSNSGSTHPVVAPKTVDSIQLQIVKVDAPPPPHTLETGNGLSIMLGRSVYYANTPTPTYPAQYIFRYDIDQNSFTEVPANDDICGCGNTSKMVSDGNNLFYIANFARKFVPNYNLWYTLNYPSNIKNNIGDAGVVCSNNRVYFLGGISSSVIFNYYDIATDGWVGLPDAPYATTASEMAALNDTVYAIGGDENTAKFSSYNQTTGWKSLPDLPFKYYTSSSSHYSASFANRYIFVLSAINPGGSTWLIYIYDSHTGKWATQSIDTKIGDYQADLFSDNNNLYMFTVGSPNRLFLYKIAVTNLP